MKPKKKTPPPKKRQRSTKNDKQEVSEPTSGSLASTLGQRSGLSQMQASLTRGSSTAEAKSGAGDLEALQTRDSEGFESVVELAEEGQDLEAEQKTSHE